MRQTFLVAMSAVLFLSLSVIEGLAERRVALVLGNSSYQNASSLDNPINDAVDMAAALDRLGFDVLIGIDLDYRNTRKKLREFAAHMQHADVALFYYAGHALQVNGTNYIAPTDAKLSRQSDLDFEAIPVDQIFRHMEDISNTVLVILDACRDNPLARTFQRTRSTTASPGLAKPEKSVKGSLVAFATQPGNVAYDGDGRNSPFTTALLNNIERPGVDISTLMTDVRKEVYEATNGNQLPWTTSGLLGRFYFKKADEEVQESGARTGKETENDPLHNLERQLSDWQKVQDSDDVQELLEFVEAHPNGVLAQIAQQKLAFLRAQKDGISTARLPEDVDRRYSDLPIQQENRPKTNLEWEAEAGAEPSSILDLQKSIEEESLVRSVQMELERLGCEPGPVDGQWGPKSAAALARFSEHSRLRFEANEASQIVLDELLERDGRTCPLTCGPRFYVNGDECVLKSCASGLVLNSKGTCVRKRVSSNSQTSRKQVNQRDSCVVFDGLRSCK